MGIRVKSWSYISYLATASLGSKTFSEVAGLVQKCSTNTERPSIPVNPT
jgi:hypothetical protein